MGRLLQHLPWHIIPMIVSSFPMENVECREKEYDCCNSWNCNRRRERDNGNG